MATLLFFVLRRVCVLCVFFLGKCVCQKKGEGKNKKYGKSSESGDDRKIWDEVVAKEIFTQTAEYLF